MKVKAKKVAAEKFKIEPISTVIKKLEKGVGEHAGRKPRFDFFRIKAGFGQFLRNQEISKISPLVHYYNTKNQAQLHCRTVRHEGRKGVFVYNERANKSKTPELVAAN